MATVDNRQNLMEATMAIVASWVRNEPVGDVTMSAREARTTFSVTKLWLTESIIPARETYTVPVQLTTGAAELVMHLTGGKWQAVLKRKGRRRVKVSHRYPLSAVASLSSRLRG